MKTEGENIDIINQSPHKNKVHGILAYSYSLYFIFFIIGIVLDSIFKARFFSEKVGSIFGVFLIILATFLIFWAQKSSRVLDKTDLKKESFMKGPYLITRSPTHWGLFFLLLGFGILINAIFVVFFTMISFIFTKILFLDKQEKILEKKYGTPYKEYKESVWL